MSRDDSMSDLRVFIGEAVYIVGLAWTLFAFEPLEAVPLVLLTTGAAMSAVGVLLNHERKGHR